MRLTGRQAVGHSEWHHRYLFRNLEFGTVPSLGGGTAMLELLFNAHGEQKAAQPQYSASDVTVTGLPIERASSQEAEAIIIGQFSLSNYQTIGTGHGQAEWSLDYTVPDEAPNGIYQLILTGQGWSMNPWVSGLTQSDCFMRMYTASLPFI